VRGMGHDRGRGEATEGGATEGKGDRGGRR